MMMAVNGVVMRLSFFLSKNSVNIAIKVLEVKAHLYFLKIPGVCIYEFVYVCSNPFLNDVSWHSEKMLNKWFL